MPTPFGAIYERAVFKFTDYGFLDTSTEESIALYKSILKRYLFSAIADFQYACKYDLTANNSDEEYFDNDLGNEEIEILAIGIVNYWLTAKTLNSELFRNVIYPSDYHAYSPANLLKEMQILRDTVRKEYVGRINTYSFRHNDLDKLKT